MVKYVLNPKNSILHKTSGLDMVVEGKLILGILTDKDRFPDMRENLKTYTINVEKRTIEINMDSKLRKDILGYLNSFWQITKYK